MSAARPVRHASGPAGGADDGPAAPSPASPDGAKDGDANGDGNGYGAQARDAAALALAAHAADRSLPLAEFDCGRGAGGAALVRAGFTAIDGFDPSGEDLAAARGTGVYRRLARADLAALDEVRAIPPGIYANAAVIDPLDAGRIPPQALDAMLALLPPGGCLVFALPGGGASVGRFRTRALELCEHFVASPVFRASTPRSPGRDLQTTLYVLKKR